MPEMHFPRIHQSVAAVSTLLLHVFLFLALWAGTSSSPRSMPQEKPIPVELVQENPKDIAAAAGRVVPRRHDSPAEPQLPDPPAPTDPLSENPKQEVKPSSAPQVPESIVDCRFMDEAACSPCLADPKICTACCQKSDKPGAGGTDPTAPSSPAGTCLHPPCAETDPCPPDALAEMTSSFCPRVRSSIYAKLGTIRLSVPDDTRLSARIQVTVNAAGTLKLEGLLSSSGHAGFDQAVRDSVARAAAVVPPARILGCVAARGCIFPVTIGADKAPSSGGAEPAEQ